MYDEILKLLYDTMREKKVTLEMMAEHFDVSRTTIHYWMYGVIRLPLKHTIEMCNYLDIPFNLGGISNDKDKA